MGTVLGLLAVALLVFLNGFFVAAEFALVGSRPTRLAQLAAEGSAGARAAERAIEHLDNYIAATQLGITLASLGLGWIGEPVVARLFDPLFEYFLHGGRAETLKHTLAFGTAFSLVTMLHIVFGELAPKSIALQRPETTSIVVARPTTWFLVLFRPVIMVMNGVGNFVVRLLGFEPASGHEQVHSVEELAMLVQSSREAGLLAANEERLLQNVFDFGDIRMREVMQPRVEMDAIACDSPLSTLLATVGKKHHSRYPVYDGSVDNVVGILHTKDLLDAVVANPALLTDSSMVFDLKTILRDPLFVPAMTRLDEVLERMKQTNTHLAIVVDEYGGTAGMATMEDILEELVGEVQDEFDGSLASPRTTAQGGVELDGLLALHDIIERFGDPGVPYESATLGGFVTESLERIPRVGDRVTFGKYDLYVRAMDEMRVARVGVVRRRAGAESPQDVTADPGQAG